MLSGNHFIGLMKSRQRIAAPEVVGSSARTAGRLQPEAYKRCASGNIDHNAVRLNGVGNFYWHSAVFIIIDVVVVVVGAHVVVGVDAVAVVGGVAVMVALYVS